MKNLIRFELIKLVKSKKNSLILGLFLLLLLLFAASNEVKERLDKINYAEQYKEKASYNSMIASGTKNEIIMNHGMLEEKVDTLTEAEKEEIRNYIEWLELSYEYYSKDAMFWTSMSVYVKEKNWDAFLYNCINEQKLSLFAIQDGVIELSDTDWSTIVELDNSIRKNEYLMEYGLIPDLSGNNMDSILFLYKSFKFLFPLVITTMISLLTIDMFSQEMDFGTYKFLLLQPFSRKKIYAAKLVSGYIYSTIATCLVYICSYILIRIGCGAGNINTIIEIPYISDTAHYISYLTDLEYTSALVDYEPIKERLIIIIYIVIVYHIFIVALSCLISSISQRITESISLLAGVLGVSLFFLYYIELPDFIMRAIPFSYSNVIEVINGKYGMNITWGNFVIVSVSFVLSFIGVKIFEHAEIAC